jgi:hypothetical protein
LIPGTEKPIDPWLRSLWWSGMQLMKEDPQAMEVHLTKSEFEHYQQTYQPEKWKKIKTSPAGAEIWECGEVGEWTTNPGDPQPQDAYARYRESNVWGVIPFK